MSYERKADTRPASIRAIRLVVIFVGLLFFGYALSSCSSPTENAIINSNESGYEPLPANTSEAGNSNSLSDIPSDAPELAHFKHDNDYHSQLSCLICHRRDNNSARISFPGKQNHSPCIGCHTQQFADKKSSICTVCHTDAETGALKAFPPLRSFSVKFQHSQHTRVANCATCHKHSGTGVALSIPSGRQAHSTCFQCHSSQSSHNMSSCGVCHQEGRRPAPIRVFRTAFARSFSHAKHKELSCSECHSLTRRGKQISSPAAAMHKAKQGTRSCATCHNDQRAFGTEDFSNCKRCHTGDSFKFPRQRL